MILNLSPELEARVSEWGHEFNRPCEDLAVELLEEYFEDSDTGAEISQAVRSGQTSTYSWEDVRARLDAVADKV